MAELYPGYAGKVLRVDLSTGKITEEHFDEAVLKQYVGGSGLGAKILYDEVPPEVKWSDAENRLIICAGPLSGTRVGGSGGFCAVTKGPLTNGAATSQAQGYLAAYLRSNGYDGIIFQGAAPKLVLYLVKISSGRELRLILSAKITKRGCTGKSFRLGEGRLLGTESHKARHVASTNALLLLVVLSFPRKIVDTAQAARS
jgi:hypothetical protein